MPKKRRRRNFRSPRYGARNYDDAAYAGFRKAVRKRDGGMCRYPGCGSKKRLEVHHIKKWSNHPSMRYDTTNGITLCKTHHNITKGNEEVYESFFYKILEIDAIRRLKKDEEDK